MARIALAKNIFLKLIFCCLKMIHTGWWLLATGYWPP